MLAIVASEHKDIVPVLAAHIYTVCPTAIPRLPKISSDASEEQLMDALGMIKGKDGNYETFERFLGRTEVSVLFVLVVERNMLRYVCLYFDELIYHDQYTLLYCGMSSPSPDPFIFSTYVAFFPFQQGLISMVADIMSSDPSDNGLVGGHGGAVNWLARFLSDLPPAPASPLPLITAPVLEYVETINNDVIASHRKLCHIGDSYILSSSSCV